MQEDIPEEIDLDAVDPSQHVWIPHRAVIHAGTMPKRKRRYAFAKPPEEEEETTVSEMNAFYAAKQVEMISAVRRCYQSFKDGGVQDGDVDGLLDIEEECINHVSKRLGSRLRALKAIYATMDHVRFVAQATALENNFGHVGGSLLRALGLRSERLLTALQEAQARVLTPARKKAKRSSMNRDPSYGAGNF
ncbi:hypothetical protein HAZT_HAZT002776 [Hyalella azteca]|uniref:Uncharacterized protein n=1 Tax=Hyalella azteca TaxID=294128 RepID=A0A6A0GY86_HYAAZ|nr:hypothetical protein HAZT_HAZT002776 [Hyalella azteca]